jgi:serine/threonine-protein phosphatase 2A regulatory subunit A
VQAVESLNKICEELSQQQIEENFIPLVLRLSKADWFTSKISATGLYQTPYSRATPPSQEALRQHYGQLVHDDTPMVRRQAANNLAKFIKAMPPSIVIEEMIPLFQHLAADDQDSVRLLTVDILIAIAEAVPKEQQSSHGVLLTALRSLFEDKSWRVRYMVADRFEKVRPGDGETEHTLIGSRLRKPSTKRSSTETSSLRLSSSLRTQRPRSAARSRGRFQVRCNGGYNGWCHKDK